MKRWGWIVMAVALAACSSDGDVDGGSGDSGVPVTGCATMGGPMCPAGTMCCSGVPYPMEGVCNTSCDTVSDRHAKVFLVTDEYQVIEVTPVTRRMLTPGSLRN